MKVENQQVKLYIEELVVSKLKECELFVKIFGEDFAQDRLDINFVNAYTNEERADCGGYYRGSDGSITICKSGPNDTLLTPEDIEKSSDLKHTCLHEAIHAILTKLKKECSELGIEYGTGILEQYLNNNEIGRALNEGLTNWICEKAGLKSFSYMELTNFVKQLELAIGPEAVMEMGKGDIKNNITKQLGMTYQDTIRLLRMADQLYVDDRRLSKVNISIEKLERRIKIYNYLDNSDNLDEEEINKLLKELDEINKSDEHVSRYYKNIHLLPPAERMKKLTEELNAKNQCKETLKKEIAKDTVQFESFVFEQYFKNEFEQMQQADISEETFRKFCKLNLLLCSKNEYAQDLEGISLEFKKEFPKIRERFEQKLIADARKSIISGNMTGKRINEIIDLIRMGEGEYSLKEQELYETIAHIMSPHNPNIFLGLVDELNRNNDLENISKYSLLEITKLGNKKENDIREVLWIKDGEIKGAYRAFGSRNIRADAEINGAKEVFNYTVTTGHDYSVIMEKFLALKRNIQNKNPNATIHIINRTIVINDNGEMQYYYIKGEDLYPMEPTKQIQLKRYFKPEDIQMEITKYEEKNPVKEFWNKIKRKFMANKKDNIIYDQQTLPVIQESDEEMSKFESALIYSRFDEEYKRKHGDKTFEDTTKVTDIDRGIDD